MFDMSWGEIMVIGGVALVVIGPKDLPKALRTVGQMTTKVRRMAGEFQAQFSEAMREAELEEVRKEVDGLNRSVSTATSAAFNPIQTIRDELKSSVEGKTAAYVPPVSEPYGATMSDIPPDPPIPDVPPSGEWTPGQSDVTLSPVVETGPIPREEVAAPAISAPLDPETAPLVPMPDEPSLPSPDPSRIVTGPGLEPVVETEMPRDHRKDART